MAARKGSSATAGRVGVSKSEGVDSTLVTDSGLDARSSGSITTGVVCLSDVSIESCAWIARVDGEEKR